MKIKNIVFDYDGTCTQIDMIYKQYLDRYLIEFNKRIFPPNQFTAEDWPKPVSTKEWKEAQAIIRKNSPQAGWTLAITPAAPAAADPYILAFESAKLILRTRRKGKGEADPPFEAHRDSNEAYEAPWRPEARKVITTLLKKGVNVYFISNSSSEKIKKRLKELLKMEELPDTLQVQSDAAKFRISDLPVSSTNSAGNISPEARKAFESLPAVHNTTADRRPVYLRRGNYYAAICAVLGSNVVSLNNTVFCGDIWEMDLAMPAALGGKIHLIKRAAPFNTYPYELDAVKAANGKISKDMNGLLDWF